MTSVPQPQTTNDVFIVAIGGSAGSLPVIIQFFEHTPLDNAAYVILRHMPIDQQSQLKLILERHAVLRVEEVTVEQHIEKNKVYIPPSSCHLTLQGQRLVLVNRPPSGPNRAIDLFFSALAAAGLGYRAIGVVLSGGGFDGVEGIGKIKQTGGLAIAQEPAKSQFASIPRAAIEAGYIHLVAEPQEIPALIRQHVQAHLPRHLEGGDG